MAKNTIITVLPDVIDEKEPWLVDYWAKELQVTVGRLRQCIACVGPRAKRVRTFLKDDHRIALEDQKGTIRLIGRITPLNDGGFSVQCPYHAEKKEGWLFKVPIDYSTRQSFGRINNCEQFIVSGTVKMSLHMGGFVQFSSGAGIPVVSGYCEVLQKPKGLGLKSPEPIEVTTGPLCGFTVQGLHEFKPLTTEKSAVFMRDDLWHHPEYSPENDAYNVEMFMLPIAMAKSAESINGKRLARAFLPFYAKFRFQHTLRILEFPGLWFCLGVIVSPMPMDRTVVSGYKLCSPAFGEPGKQKYAISAWYPRPTMLKDLSSESLDYEPLEAKTK